MTKILCKRGPLYLSVSRISNTEWAMKNCAVLKSSIFNGNSYFIFIFKKVVEYSCKYYLMSRISSDGYQERAPSHYFNSTL